MVAVFYLQNNLILQADGMPTEMVFYTITVNSLSIPLHGAVRGSMRPRTYASSTSKMFTDSTNQLAVFSTYKFVTYFLSILLSGQ